jgi:Na+/proline symporter
MEVLTKLDGLLLLGGYFLAMIAIVSFLREKGRTKSGYLVADRNAPWIVTAFSMAVTWVWAPSMFTASEKAYTHGFAGVFWFVVPNVLTLILFAFFAKKMRQLRPEGWTFSSYIQEKYSNRAHNMFLIESFGLQVCSMAVQLLAGAVIFHKITGMNFFLTTVILATVPLLYTFTSGLRASILTDFVKMGFIILVLLLGLPIMTSNVGIETLFKGIGGISGDFGSLFSKSGITVMLSFGIPTTIGLLSGTFGDQMFWQRTFAVEKTKVKKTMVLAALIFAIVPISLSLFGFFAAGAGLPIEDTQLVNVASVIAFTPKWFLYLFFLLIISGLISTVDSILCAVSSVAGHDLVVRFAKDKSDVNSVRIARMTMIIVAILAIGVANIPGIQITYLFLFYGTLRSSVMLPTIFAIKGYRMSERGLYYGIITSLTIGLPIFAIGNLNGNIPMILTGSLFTILASGIMALKIKNK